MKETEQNSWFNKEIIAWYKKNKRDLPWRNQTNPYFIWLSEIILQQTQVAQGLSYYYKFITHYPTIFDLAKAKEDAVLKDWQGLGYYSRARNLHASAKYVVNELGGVFPQSFEEIKKLKGVGDYTAAAIASFAYNLPHAVVDGNVYRVLSRVFGIETPIDSTLGKKVFQELATTLLNPKLAAQHNQAIMEFGSQQCKVVHPGCQNCVLQNKCFAFTNNKIDLFPTKEKKAKITQRFFTYIIFVDEEKNTVIYKRDKNDIWQGLYEFFLIEDKHLPTFDELLNNKVVKQNFKRNTSIIKHVVLKKHILSHQHLYAQFFIVKVEKLNSKTGLVVKLSQLSNYAWPRLIDKFFDVCSLQNIC